MSGRFLRTDVEKQAARSTRWRTAPALRHYHLLPSVRRDLLASLGRHDEVRAEFARAAELTTNEQERALLRARPGS